jgi:hypothetical protein
MDTAASTPDKMAVPMIPSRVARWWEGVGSTKAPSTHKYSGNFISGL